MGIRYKRKRHKKGKSIPKVIEFVVKNRKEIRDAVRDVADISKNVKSVIDHIRRRTGEGLRVITD